MADETAPEKPIEELRDEVRRLMLQALIGALAKPKPNLDVNKVRAVAEAYAFITAPERS
ncbi:hypothetical protein ACIG47_16870 [Promicromonospora sp. NPDC052451]|uniref:hypothetical protein n=1 Tax=Promicromonospora sp. NPDC052451 TaxID=3364407 RepID=UPI0037C7BD6E